MLTIVTLLPDEIEWSRITENSIFRSFQFNAIVMSMNNGNQIASLFFIALKNHVLCCCSFGDFFLFHFRQSIVEIQFCAQNCVGSGGKLNLTETMHSKWKNALILLDFDCQLKIIRKTNLSYRHTHTQKPKIIGLQKFGANRDMAIQRNVIVRWRCADGGTIMNRSIEKSEQYKLLVSKSDSRNSNKKNK